MNKCFMLIVLYLLNSHKFMSSHAVVNIGYFWHITDLHYNALNDERNGNDRNHCWQWREQQPGANGAVRRPAMGPFGDYACDSPWTLIESAGKAMRRRQGDNIEFVLWTGDALSYSSTKLSASKRLMLLQNVTDLLSRTFSSQFVFPVVGHDDPASVNQLAELWRRWLPPEAMQTFERGGYYSIEQKERKLRIVILNTNLWVGRERGVDERNRNQDEQDDGKLQWDWLETVLAKSYQNRETVYLVGHIPPGSDERQMGALPLPHRGYTQKNNAQYVAMVRRYHKIIMGQFFGHLHSDTFRVIYNKNGAPISWIMMAPSITPKRISAGANNPGLRLYKFDTDTGQVLDYTQFYMDLNQVNSNNNNNNEDKEWTVDWVPEYNLTSWYHLSHVTPASLHNLVDKFTQSQPDENFAFSRYFVANSVSIYRSPSEGSCDSSCAYTHYCAVTRVDYDEFRHCIKTAASALASPAQHTQTPFRNKFTALFIYVPFNYIIKCLFGFHER